MIVTTESVVTNYKVGLSMSCQERLMNTDQPRPPTAVIRITSHFICSNVDPRSV
jgi:hypothetical protein